MAIPRIARAPHTSKAPDALRNNVYPLHIILDALTTYSLGYSHDETCRRTKAKTGRAISSSTLSAWLAEHDDVMGCQRLRDMGCSRFPPEQTIRSMELHRPQVYRYAFHRPKLEMLRESEQHKRFASVANFLEAIPLICPHTLFQAEHDAGCASQAQPAFPNAPRIIVNRKENEATRAAALVIPTVEDNRRRHDTLQHFMLANDSVTLAVGVPIWLTDKDIAELESNYNIELGSHVITGHLAFLQVHNGALHILDYKPIARTNKPIAQLAVYALALTRLVPGLTLFDIKCAWFNEKEYFEFFPRTLFAQKSR